MKFKTIAAAALIAVSPIAASAGSLGAGMTEPVVAPADDDIMAMPSFGSFGLGGGAAAAVAALTVIAIAASSGTGT